ncbi:MAG: hypothetical protein NT075_24670 [Chloroflexi bacterium]|nr:hypothetical protein [Chloroflexota bacterium]
MLTWKKLQVVEYAVRERRWPSRLFMFCALSISILWAFGFRPLFAHENRPVNDQGIDNLLVDEAQCGIDGYRIPGTDLCTHGADLPPTVEQIQAIQAARANTPASPIACSGDGVSGKRVQMMYVHTSDQPDQYAQLVEKIRAIAADVDAIYEASAQETGGHRHVLFVTDANCEIDVVAVTLPPNANNSFVGTISGLNALGYDAPDRKYLLFVDSALYCGISTVKRDSQPGLDNANNQEVGYARIDRICWGPLTAAHELTHLLGGVQTDAPHTTNGWHCTDEHDIMCYPDTNDSPAMTVTCDEESHEYRLDCHHDDYFHTDPAVGNYLYTHWNVANSEFLSDAPISESTPAAGESLGQNITISGTIVYLPLVSK